MNTIKLVSVNIEGDNHWETILPFLQSENPDVVCVQEVFEDQLQNLSSFTYQHFTQNTLRPYWSEPNGKVRSFGTALVSKYPLTQVRDLYYWKPSEIVPVFTNGTPEEKHESHWYGCTAASIDVAGSTFKVLTTQFTWTSDGMPDDLQRTDLENLLSLVRAEGELVLCGDFNIPRIQNELYAKLIGGLHDNIPQFYTCSLDGVYHRTRNTPAWDRVQNYMVDYLFTTPTYSATNVRLQDGVSDHKAIVATITRS